MIYAPLFNYYEQGCSNERQPTSEERGRICFAQLEKYAENSAVFFTTHVGTEKDVVKRRCLVVRLWYRLVCSFSCDKDKVAMAICELWQHCTLSTYDAVSLCKLCDSLSSLKLRLEKNTTTPFINMERLNR